MANILLTPGTYFTHRRSDLNVNDRLGVSVFKDTDLMWTGFPLEEQVVLYC